MKINNIGVKQALALQLPFRIPNKHIYLAYGSIRTGKTVFLSIAFIEWVLNRGSGRYFVVAQTMTNVIDNVINPLQMYLSRKGIKTYIKNLKMYIELPTLTHISRIEIAMYSSNNAASFKRIQGGTFQGGFIDEAALMNADMLETCIGRCITYKDYSVFMTSNPEGSEFHWFYQQYILDSKKKDFAVLKLTLLDNPLFNELDIERYRMTFSDVMFKRKIMGDWVQAEGACYLNLPNEIQEMPKVFDYINIGIDYGETDATSAVAVGVSNGKYYILSQYYHKASETGSKTIIEYEHDLYEYIKKISKQFKSKNKVWVYCETSPISLFNLLSKREIEEATIKKVNKKKENHKTANAIQERIDAANILINTDKLFIYDTSIPLYTALSNAVYKDGVRRDDGYSDIDSLDSFEYAIKVDIKLIMKGVNNE